MLFSDCAAFFFAECGTRSVLHLPRAFPPQTAAHHHRIDYTWVQTQASYSLIHPELIM